MAFSGCGIAPNTFLVRLKPCCAPSHSGLCDGSSAPSGAIAEGDPRAPQARPTSSVGGGSCRRDGRPAPRTLALFVLRGEQRLRCSTRKPTLRADELQIGVAEQHARQHARLGDDLEALQTAITAMPFVGTGPDLAQYRRMGGDGAAAQIVAVGKAAGTRTRSTLGSSLSRCQTRAASSIACSRAVPHPFPGLSLEDDDRCFHLPPRQSTRSIA